MTLARARLCFLAISLLRNAALLSLALWAFLPHALATPSFPSAPASEWHAVPTYESIGLYWDPPGKSATNTARVEFRVAGSTDAFRAGLDLWYDTRNAEYRGSIVELQPNTTYEIKLTLMSGTTALHTHTINDCANFDNLCSKTWSDDFTGTEINIRDALLPPTATPQLTLNSGHSGSRDADGTIHWKIYTAPEGQNTIDQSSLTDNNLSCVVLNNVQFVVLRGLKLQNCRKHGIDVRAGTHDVVIEKNTITGWGTLAAIGVAGDGGIFCHNGSVSDENQKARRVTMQQNRIGDPRHPGTPWQGSRAVDLDNPPNGTDVTGAYGIRLDHCGNNQVVRHNDLYSTPNPQTGVIHHFKDAIGGSGNFQEGFPRADSDIYGNAISHAYDDAIEAEGWNRNVRIWANYMDLVFLPIGNVVTSVGPLYVWRNVSNHTARMRNPDPGVDIDGDGEVRAEFIKGGDHGGGQSGRAYYFHNTVLQPPKEHCNASLYTCGPGYGLRSVDGALHNFVSKNNIWQIHKLSEAGSFDYRSIGASCTTGRFCEANSDLFNGKVLGAGPTPEANGWGNPAGADASSVPTYLGGTPYPTQIPSVSNEWTGDFRLDPSSKGAFTDGARHVAAIANFNDRDSALHVGAQPPNKSEMKFGRGAAITGPNAVLNASPASGAAPLTVTFGSASSLGSGTLTGITLDFGDGSPLLDWADHPAPKTHTYSVGNYTATLTISTSIGTDSDSKSVSACQVPTASFTATPQSGVAPLAVAFDASASSAVSPATIASYSITYGDGGSGTGVTQSHTYMNPGSYTATLVVTDSNNCQSAPATRQILVTDGRPAFRAAASGSYGPGIGFRAASSAATNTSSLSINRPAGTAVNDAMIASINVRPSSATIAAPTGWALVRRIDNAAGQTSLSLAVFHKVAGAGEPASYTWNVSGATWAVGGIQSFVNVDAVNPIDVENGQATPGGFTHATPSVTTTVANTMVVSSHTFATSTTWTPPTGMTEAFDVQFQPVTTNQGQSLEGNYVAQAAAGATGTKSATAAGGSGGEDIGATHILALRPNAPVLGIERPAGTSADDVMIASISARPSSATIAAPTGWALVRRIDNVAGQTISLAVFRKVAGAGEPASYIWDISGATWAVGGIQSFVNVDAGNPIDVESGHATPGGLTHATPSVTTTVANAMVVTSHTFATSTTWTPPTGMTEAFDVQFQPAATNTGQSMEGNYVVQATAGATGTKSATAAGGSGAEDIGVTHILGLRPVAP
jgi:PKD repeat protein